MNTYHNGHGTFQRRADYYFGLKAGEQVELFNELFTIYTAIWENGGSWKKQVPDWKEKIGKVKSTPGFCRAWGFALSIIAEEEEEGIVDAFEALVDSILEILPAYCRMKFIAKNEENQWLVEQLNDIGTKYRLLGNPLFYACDDAVEIVAETWFQITKSNCKFLGINKSVLIHIQF